MEWTRILGLHHRKRGPADRTSHINFLAVRGRQTPPAGRRGNQSTRPATWRLAWYRRGGRFLAVLDLLCLRATFCLGDLQLGSLLILKRDLAREIAVQVNPRRRASTPSI